MLTAGDKYGRLTVVSYFGSQLHKRLWNCVCECGRKLVVNTGHLRSGHTKSCGCLAVDTVMARSKTHGHTVGKFSPEYASWSSMIQRAKNPKLKHAEHYFGKGITVCHRWEHSFEAFLADMGPRPAGTSLDRIDNNAGYYPENCRWANASAQARNSSQTVFVVLRGERRPLVEWCELLGVSINTVRARVRKQGLDYEAALTKRKDHR